jgi:hypothetical protein
MVPASLFRLPINAATFQALGLRTESIRVMTRAGASGHHRASQR